MCLRDYDAPRKSPHIYQRLILFNLNSFQLIRVILMYLEPRAEKTGAPKKPDSQHAARREELREIGHNFIHPHHGNVLCSRKKVRSARQVTLGETMPYAVPTSKPTFRNVLNAMQAFSITLFPKSTINSSANIFVAPDSEGLVSVCCYLIYALSFVRSGSTAVVSPYKVMVEVRNPQGQCFGRTRWTRSKEQSAIL